MHLCEFPSANVEEENRRPEKVAAAASKKQKHKQQKRFATRLKAPNTKYYKKLTQKERIKSCASENENRNLSKKCQNRVVNTYFAQAEKKSCYASERAHEKFRCTPNVCPTAPLLRENFIFSPIT